MTGFTAYNHAAFAYAQAQWRDAGHDATTPFDANSRVWHRHYRRAFDPYTDKCEYGDPLLREMFAEDVATLLGCDAVVVLPGWERSSGVSRELPIALLFKLPVYDAATFEQIPLSVSIQFARTDETILQEAQRLVHGDRGASYGHPLHDFERSAKIWGAILGCDVTAEQVALCMIGVKISRECNRHKRDNATDIAGYAETLQMVVEERERLAKEPCAR
jgi:hypothetical protein